MEETKHKCLLYWHKKAMGSLPMNEKGDKMILYPGYNSFDFADLDYIYKAAKGHFDRGVITLYGIKIKDGKFIETDDLSKIALNDLNEILEQTYNPDTLNDLSDPAVVRATYTRQAVERKTRLKEAVGTEADNIDEYKEAAKAL